ncbi:tRNA pseudouridine(38-40) synthase TruA [Maribacter halichondriae]|uniref:tRNA pseudouridine(38-40) synthase TruA n=1 Tax=Maribacter halichondriae TaxID=2980554 RepID=UPI00235A0914|nr:tRNA pseudouridine(38-40) synthase TruA [Maribacter sp. Hal144]
MRYFIQFSYFGKHYHGWQNQPNAISVQEVLEDVMSKLLGNAVSLTGAGRTDAGVHAKQMFAHFDTEKIADLTDLTYRLNAFLPDDISVQKIFEVTDEAHARFDATERTYEYWITQVKNPFLNEAAYFVKQPLDFTKMNVAAQLLLQHHDFECFSKSNTDVKTYRCELKKAVWEEKDGLWIFTVSADRFLRNMVRAMVGTLLEVGQGKLEVVDVKTILKSKDRAQAGPSVPAKGLYLTQVNYPESIRKTHG